MKNQVCASCKSQLKGCIIHVIGKHSLRIIGGALFCGNLMPDEQGSSSENKRRNSDRVNAKEFRRKEKHQDSGMKVIIFLLIGGILGGVVSYYAVNLVFEGTMSSLEADKNSYEDDYSTISDEYRTLFEDYNALVQDKKSLEGIVNSLYEEKKELQDTILELSQQLSMAAGNVSGLTLEIELLKDCLVELNGVLYLLNSSMNEYSIIPQAYKRVLNTETLDEIGETVETVAAGSVSPLDAYRSIYDHITSTISYVHDVEFPYISGYSYVDIYDFDIIQDVNISKIQNYIQTPGYTEEYAQGDCDDQAVLAYAMIGYYHREMPTDTIFYLASLSFDDGSGHLAVFSSSSQGLLIIDPAGHHFTSQSGQDAFRDSQSELSFYNSKWTAYGGITSMTLHSVSVINGDVNLTFNGDLSSVADFLD